MKPTFIELLRPFKNGKVWQNDNTHPQLNVSEIGLFLIIVDL